MDLTVQGYTFIQEGVRCTLLGLSKQSHPRHQKPTLEIASYPDHRICPVVSLVRRYVEVTKQFRAQSSTGLQPNQPFIGITKPQAPKQACTIGRWVKTVLKDAGIHTTIFMALSTRSVSTSAAVSGGTLLQEILSQADWSSSSTLDKHYFRPFQPFHQLFLTKLQTCMFKRN